MRISFLHTAQVHVATFDTIFGALAPQAVLTHHVDADLLERARRDGLDAVRDETLVVLRDLAQADAVICTCSTLGPLADAAALPHIVRIDRPMMQEASRAGDNVLVALCLESTQAATLALLAQCAADAGRVATPQVVMCDSAWAAFERGDMDGFADQIATRIRSAIAGGLRVDAIVLAQASMRVAADQLIDLGVPVLSSPLPAARQAIAVASARMGSE